VTERGDLPKDIAALQALVIAQQAQINSHAEEIERLKLIIAKLKRMQFGRRSEKLEREIEQLELRLEELQIKAPAVVPTAEQPQGEQTAQPARQGLPEHLPRERVVHEPACNCPDCGTAMRKIGEDVSEVLDYVPAHYKVIRHVRPKRACPACERIVQAPAPSRPIAGSYAGPGLLAHILVAKYCDHLPLYRQSQIGAREGVQLERSTMAEWVHGCFDLF
jgi:transposase